MRKQRTFRPTGDRLESRDVPASLGLASRIALVPHAALASRLNTPFAHTLRLNVAGTGLQLSSNRTASTRAGLNQLANLGLNANNLGFNLGSSLPTRLTINQIRSVLNQLTSGSPLGNAGTLTTLLRANINNPNLTAALGNNTTLINALRTNINNPNLPGILASGGTTSLLNSGLNFPATFSTQGSGTGTGFGLNMGSLLGSPFGNSGLLSTGTGGFVNFQ